MTKGLRLGLAFMISFSVLISDLLLDIEAVYADENVVIDSDILNEEFYGESEEKTNEDSQTDHDTYCKEYVHDGYTIAFQVAGEWNDAYNAKVVLKNTGDKSIRNWILLCDISEEITGAYNAEVLMSDDSILFKNKGYNGIVKPDGEVEFGFTVSKENGIVYPDDFRLVSKEYLVSEDDYSVEIVIKQSWGTGSVAELIITNKSDTDIEAWNLEFDGNGIIGSAWNASITEDAGHYHIQCPDYAQIIRAGSSYTVGLNLSCADFEIDNVRLCEISYKAKKDEISQNSADKDEYKDSDDDGIPDSYEIEFGTDPYDKDTDDDNLTDYEELFITGTDPLIYDTDEDGVSDYESDSDEDGIPNGRELEAGMDPSSPDTDFDGISDGDESDGCGTDPLNDDTDGDGISDGDELKIGTDPLSDITDGIKDCERMIVQQIDSDSEVVAFVNDNENLYKLSLSVNAAGNADRMVVKESPYAASIANDTIVGIIPSFEYDNKLDSMTINFELSDELLSQNGQGNISMSDAIRNYSIAYFSDELNTYLPIESKYDAHTRTVSTTTNKQGTYFLMNIEKWEKKFTSTDSANGNNGNGGRNTDAIIASLPQSIAARKVNYKVYKDHVYAVIPVAHTWDDAKLYCENLKGHLLCINNREEQQFIEKNVLTKYANVKYWIGGYTDSDLDKFEWVTGEPFTYTNWRHDEPNHEYEKCLEIYDFKNKDYFGLWNNEPNEEVKQFICEWGDDVSSYYFAHTWNPVPGDFGEISKTNSGDYDEDGLTNAEELMFVNPESDMFTLKELMEKYKEKTGFECSSIVKKSDSFMINSCDIFIVPIYSDPTKKDSDKDGIVDGKIDYKYKCSVQEDEFVFSVDNNPLQKGIFIEGKAIAGKLTIVSCNNFPFGHAFLLYQSFVNDSFDFSGFTKGYSYGEWKAESPGKYLIGCGDYISLGSSAVDAETWNPEMFENYDEIGDGDDGGVYYNRELAYVYYHNEAYSSNKAYSRYIEDEDIKSVIKILKSDNYYNFIGLNCAHISAIIWNTIYPHDAFSVKISPDSLKKQISNKKGSRTIKMTDIIGCI